MSKQGIPLKMCWQAIGGTLVTANFYTFPRATALAVSTAAPWVIPLVGALTLLMFWPVGALLARRPGKNIVDLALDGGGRPLAIAGAILFGSYFLAAAGLTLRQVSEMVVTALYPHTPQTFAMTSMMVISTLGALMSPEGTIWLNSLYLFPVLIAILVVLVGNAGWGQIRNVTPLTGHGLLPAAASLLPLTSNFTPLSYLAVFSHYVESPRNLQRGAAYAMGVATAVSTLVVMLYLMVFPLPGGLDVPFPLLEMTRLVQGGRYFERLDALWIIFWTFGSAGRIAVALQAAALLFVGAFKLPNHRKAVLPLTMAILSIALFPSNQAGAVAMETLLIRRWGFLVIPVSLLLVVALVHIRQRISGAGGKDHA